MDITAAGTILLASMLCLCFDKSALSAPPSAGFHNRLLTVSVGCGPKCLWDFKLNGTNNSHRFAPPVFFIDHKRVQADLTKIAASSPPLRLSNGVTQYSFAGKVTADPHLTLRMQFQVNDGTPVVRFRYELSSDAPKTLDKTAGRDELTYLQTSFGSFTSVREINLSGLTGLTHTYTLAENTIESSYFEDQTSAMGPILMGSTVQNSFLVAYEHGSPVPDRFLEFRFLPGKSVTLAAVKANYLAGQDLGPDHPFQTVWFETAAVSQTRFPDGLKTIKARLDSYGMKLGLWFGPTTAAASNRIARQHPEWRASWNGTAYPPEDIWETEKSYPMCMVSDYSDALADEMIRVGKQLGVTYFKWDWDDLPHHLCNDAKHLHGSETNSPEERFDSFRFQLIQRINRTADKITAAIPDAIIEFDVTEEGRAMGLSFLASGCTPVADLRSVDTSVLLLGHCFPDDPHQWQEVNLASLVLGGNGIWGDLTSVSDSGVSYIGEVLGKYKQIRDDITQSDMVTRGNFSSNPEIYEKISLSGRGAIVVFATASGQYRYISKHPVVDEYWSSQGVELKKDLRGRAKLDLTFEKPGAKLIFFGVR